jgi:hypothetical protein
MTLNFLIVDDSDSTHGSESSSSEVDSYAEECCRDVRVCQTRCDEVGCYDHCETQTQCSDSCNRTCSGDLDCPKNTVCIDGAVPDPRLKAMPSIFDSVELDVCCGFGFGGVGKFVDNSKG